MRLSSTQLETLRTRPQQTTLYLSIFEPQTIFQAQINDAGIARGARTITYDSVTLGSSGVIENGMTLLIGTTAGARDVGKIRVRSATASALTVSENSNINWQDNLYLTVLKYFELWPVYPRITLNPANEADSLFYKDYDIPYTNQNSILGTYPCAGPHRALFRGGQVWYSSTGSYNLLGDSLNYNWTFEGGSPASSSSADPGYVTYNTPGHYVASLTISGSSGGVDTTYRYVSVYDREEQGSNPPVVKWEMTNLSGGRDEGGYKASFKVYENVAISENAVVVLFADDWYGNTSVSLGGNYPNAEKIFFVGYIMDGSIHYNYQHSYVEFTAASISELMKEALGFSVSVESKASPAKWYELLDMDCRRALYHYLRWHTTALSIADFQFVGDDRKIQFFDADRTSMYDAIDNLMRNTLIGKSVSDRQGKMWMEVEAKAYSNPTGSFTPVMEITKRDWMNQPSVDDRLSDQISYLEYGGIAYSGVNTGTFAAILASAPGSAPSFRGRTDVHEGLALLGQDQLNTLVGNVWANENTLYPKVSIELGVNARNLDIAPQETAQIVIRPDDTVRNINLDGLYIPNGMSWKYDPQKQISLPSVDFRRLVNSAVGESIYIPISVPDAGFETGFQVPPLQIPPLPMLTIPPLFGGLGSNTGSSCCDFFAALGIGLGTYSSLYTKAAVESDTFPNKRFGMDYASNMNMYEASTGRIMLQNTGTITYTIVVEGAWQQTAVAVGTSSFCGLYLELRNSSGGSLATVFDYTVGCPGFGGGTDAESSGIGDSGVFKETLVVTNANYKKPSYIEAYVTNNTSPVGFKVEFTSFRVTVNGSP